MDARFGLLLGSRRDPGQGEADVLARTVALARQAEDLGLHDVWVTEHHFTGHTVSPSSLTLAAYLLGATRRVTVGTAVVLLPLHSPLHVAEQAALLDRLSGGRFALGAGRGQRLAEYELIGRGADQWREGLAPALDEVLAGLRGEVPGHPELPVVPGPRPDGGPPLYLAANSQGSVVAAAERDLPMLLYFDKGVETRAEMTAAYREAGGDPAADHAFAVYAQVLDDPEQARAFALERARAIVAPTTPPRHIVPVTRRPPTGADLDATVRRVAEHLLASHPLGPVETCVDRLVEGVERSGCTRVLCQVEADGATDRASANLDRLAREVLPRVRARLTGSRAVAV